MLALTCKQPVDEQAAHYEAVRSEAFAPSLQQLLYIGKWASTGKLRPCEAL